MKKFRDYQPDQMYLFPPSPRDWLPQDHPVYFIDEVVSQLDLSAILNDYREPKGQPPYNPVLNSEGPHLRLLARHSFLKEA